MTPLSRWFFAVVLLVSATQLHAQIAAADVSDDVTEYSYPLRGLLLVRLQNPPSVENSLFHKNQGTADVQEAFKAAVLKALLGQGGAGQAKPKISYDGFGNVLSVMANPEQLGRLRAWLAREDRPPHRYTISVGDQDPELLTEGVLTVVANVIGISHTELKMQPFLEPDGRIRLKGSLATSVKTLNDRISDKSFQQIDFNLLLSSHGLGTIKDQRGAEYIVRVKLLDD